jgi:hypothetical protein
MDDIINFNTLFVLLNILISSFKREIHYLKTLKTNLKIRNNMAQNVIAKLREKHRTEIERIEAFERKINELAPIYEPIKNFYMKYTNYTKESFQISTERNELINKVYEEIINRLAPIEFDEAAIMDPLHFKTTTLWVLKSFYQRMLENHYDGDFNDIKRKLHEMGEYSEEDIIEKLNDKFSAYVGTTPETKEMIFLNFSPKNENENGDEEVATVENIERLNLGRGGRRKTRRRKNRLITKK